MSSSNGKAIESSQLSLEQMMLQAKRSLVISGHTLDRFANDINVKNALGTLFARDVHVKLILLNPYSKYSQAHEHFHILESLGSAHDQILNTIQFLQGIFEDYNRPSKFEVFLSSYMPRFRMIVVDGRTSYLNLYMYGRDVTTTPDFVFRKLGHSAWFEATQESLDQLLESYDVIPLIKNERFFHSWNSCMADGILNRCLKTNCCKIKNNPWNTAESIILGYQNSSLALAYELKICNRNYEPGTFTIDLISPAAQFLCDPMIFSEWVEQVLDDELELIRNLHPNLLQNYNLHTLRMNVKASLELCREGDTPLKQKIWYQEYSDVFRRLIFTLLVHNPDFEMDLSPTLTENRRELILNILEWLERHKSPKIKDWLHLSVAAGLLGVDEKRSHDATSTIKIAKAVTLDQPGEELSEAVKRIGVELWDAAKSPCRIDATDLFFDNIESSRHGFKIVSIFDDYLESIVMLKYYEALLKNFPQLSIYCVPRSLRCGNDATYEDVRELLNYFPGLKSNKQFKLIENGPKIGGVNLLKLHPDIMRLINEANVLDVRGARNYEMMQGINKETYFGFMVCREFSESVAGLIAEDQPFIFIHQTPGECSFEGFQLRHERKHKGRMFAQVTISDQKQKWEGGAKLQSHPQLDIHNTREKILREFYSAKAPEFHKKFGGLLEVEVKEFLDAFSGRVLIAGCGSGKELEYLADRGCDTLGFDFSPDAVNFAQEARPHLKDCFFVENIYNLGSIRNGQFDGIVANAVLVHLLDREHLPSMLRIIWNRLNENGLCFIRMIEKDNLKEEFDRNLFGELRWFVYYSQDEIKKLSEEVGFIVEKTGIQTHTMHPTVRWVSVLLKKNYEDDSKIEEKNASFVPEKRSDRSDFVDSTKVSVLFLTADPTDTTRLRLGEEFREIKEKINQSKQRDRFELHHQPSARPPDISQAILDIQPNIVHFSGHGTTNGELCFENTEGETQPVKPNALAELFKQFSHHIDCVVLNACYSKAQANAIAEYIDDVIGMNQAIGDKAAIAFTTGFYQALGAGLDVKNAFDLGCVQIGLQNIPERFTPILVKRT